MVELPDGPFKRVHDLAHEIACDLKSVADKICSLAEMMHTIDGTQSRLDEFEEGVTGHITDIDDALEEVSDALIGLGGSINDSTERERGSETNNRRTSDNRR